jgi:tetratricopeptide (TPR) repeat protein
LLGDGRLHLGDLERVYRDGLAWKDVTWANDNSPLLYRALHAVHSVVMDHGGDGRRTFVVLGGVSGVLWILLSFRAAFRFARRPEERGPLLALLLTAGSAALFCGYVETYALLQPMVLVVLLAAKADLDRGGAPVLTGLALGVAVPLHFALVSLAPVLLVPAMAGARGPSAVAGRLGVSAGLAGVVATALLLVLGFDGAAFLADHRGTGLPVLDAPGFRAAYRLLSPVHFLDLLNELLLVAPAALAAIVLAGRPKWDADLRLAAVAVAGTLALLFLANAEVGLFRDWDAMAFVAVPLLLAGGLVLGRSLAAQAAREAGIVLGVAAGVHLGLWIAVNASASASEERFVTLLEKAPTSAHARAYGWESLASRRLGEERRPEAIDALEHSVQASPDNPRLRSMLGDLLLREGEGERADEQFLAALEQDPRSVRALEGRGVIAARREDWEPAGRLFQQALTIDPANPSAWFNLGLVFLNLDHPDEAQRAFEAALAARPDFPQARQQLERLRELRASPSPAEGAGP